MPLQIKNFETDIEVTKAPEFKAKLISTMTYKDGRTLKTVLSEENYEKLKIQPLKQGIPSNNKSNLLMF